MKSFSKQTHSGFALLLTMIVISVVLAMGLSIVNSTLKQFTLSATARDSEAAFHVANSGLDCVRYYRVRMEANYLSGTGPSISCAGSTLQSPTTISVGGDVEGYLYQFQIDAPEGPSCAEVSLYIAEATDGDIDQGLTNEGLSRFFCSDENVCTMIFSRGFNRACDDRDSLRTVQREITVTF